jgi:hypothetical protein
LFVHGVVLELSDQFIRGRWFDRWEHRKAGCGDRSCSSREIECLDHGSSIVSKPISAEEAETRHQFAIRANAILAFIECDEEQRPKLREAIIEAMLWAQTQPTLTK